MLFSYPKMLYGRAMCSNKSPYPVAYHTLYVFTAMQPPWPVNLRWDVVCCKNGAVVGDSKQKLFLDLSVVNSESLLSPRYVKNNNQQSRAPRSARNTSSL